MKRIDFGQMMQFLGNLGVIAGIVLLAYEIQQNTESLDESRNLAFAQAQQARLSQNDDTVRSLASSPYLPGIFIKYESEGREALNDEELRRFIWQSCSGLVRLDTLHAWYERGYVDEQEYRANFRRLVLGAAPRWQDIGIWPTRPAYREAVERILQDAQIQIVPPPTSAC